MIRMDKKHAFLIGVYQNPEYTSTLIELLRGERSNIYVHINPFYIDRFNQFIERYSNEKTVKIIHTQPIKWGGGGLLDSILDLLEFAIQDESNSFFHMLTGQDILIKPLSELYQFFDENSESNFLSYGKDLLGDTSKGYLSGVNRSQYYHLFDKLNYRENILHRQVEKYFVKMQQLFHIKREWPFNNYYQGSGWFSFNRTAVLEIMRYLRVNHKIVKYTFAPDEIIFQSILLNSENNYHVVNNNLRFILWDNQGEVGSPVILTEEHYGQIKESHCFFARKIHPEKSKLLIELICNNLNRVL